MLKFRNCSKGGFEPGSFDFEFGVLPLSYHAQMDSSVPPVMQHCRKVSYAIYDNLKQALRRDLEVNDIVGSVGKPTDWVHNLVIVVIRLYSIH